MRVLRSSVPEERFGGVYASDHLPIVADLLLPVAPPTAARLSAVLAGWRPPVGWRVAGPAAGAATAACLLLRRLVRESMKTLPWQYSA